MSNEKFTPGEWFVENLNEVNTEQKNICRCIRLGMETEETQANAHLIAAAPEMYKFIDWLGSVEGQCAILIKDPEIVRKAHAILKKARGEK